MSEKSIDRLLKDFFPKKGKKDWEKIAMRETQKKNPFEILSWYGKDQLLFLPYYDGESLAGLDFLRAFQDTSKNGKQKPRTWVNLPSVFVKDDKTSNTDSLNHLSRGAEGVLFDLDHSRPADLNRLMNTIEWPACFIAFRNASPSFLHSLSAFIKEKSFPDSISGALFWESVPKEGNWDFYFDTLKNFRSLGLIIPAATPTEEISDALMKGVETFEAMSLKYPAGNVFRSICFSLSANASLVEVIAKYRALKILWYQVARAYSQDNYNYGDLHLHANSFSVPDGAFAPHENMLKGTFSAIAAILGGCDSLTVECDEATAPVSRWARNVSNVLRQESFFESVADSVAGAYALDRITVEIARKAWQVFQSRSGAS